MPVLPPLSLGFRVFDRLGADGAGVELCGFLWSESGASPVEAQLEVAFGILLILVSSRL